MKRLARYILGALPLILAASCSEDLDPVINSDPTAPVLTSPAAGSSLVLTAEEAATELVFAYEKTDYGFSAAATYIAQMDLQGNEFAAPLEIATSTLSELSVTYAAFNQKLLAKGLVPGEESAIELRIKSTINSSVADEFSEVIDMQVTPYEVALEYPRLYLPGDYQGWDPANENTIIYSVKSDNVYEGFIHVLGGSGEFKVNEGPNWDVNYGDDGGDGTLEENGENIIADGVGTFKLTVDLAAKTYTLGAPLYWGIIGDATPGGWDASTPMEFDADENILTVTVDLGTGVMKFRANDAWDYNYGDEDLDGVLEPGGADIPVEEAGNYIITLDFKVPGEVSYALVKN
ncbi:SusF/SusE family outer membrane protein [Echinicola soli]|uniref:SusF/SusE family outer membrane protein n=1 Tax=Echinicola soli TaxID=2591634 RepID=A0A514CJK2_9BACT|nr:SusE domain-containing protein [Echinicola soli]QDH79995.1 SusF/SusE family outer membrane protein [Echinicola soli]